MSRVDFNDFAFKLHGHKHTFQAQSRAERDSWIAAIETRATEAKASREGIVSSAGYKSSLDKFGTSYLAHWYAFTYFIDRWRQCINRGPCCTKVNVETKEEHRW